MKFTKQNKAFQFLGWVIAYCPYEKFWFVFDWDYDQDLHIIGPRHRTKNEAMDWCGERS